MIGESFDVAKQCHKMRRRLDHDGIGLHLVDKIVKNLPIKFIDDIFFFEDGACFLAIVVDKGIEDIREHAACSRNHFEGTNAFDEGMIVLECIHALGDIDCNIADTLKIAIDVHSREQQAQVDGHGLREREDPLALAIDGKIELVHALLAVDDELRKFEVPFGERPNGRIDLLIDERSHANKLRAKRIELVFEVSVNSGQGVQLRVKSDESRRDGNRNPEIHPIRVIRISYPNLPVI